MNRSEMREQAFVLLYESEFFKDKPALDLEEIYSENIDVLSEYGKILFEMMNCENVPESVVINEAVELAKKYSGAEDSKFVNGILGSFSRSR